MRSTYREIIYSILDKYKLLSDDSYYTEDHIVFLMKKVRSFLLAKKAKEDGMIEEEDNKQTVCLDLELANLLQGAACGSSYLRSIDALPKVMEGSVPKIMLLDSFNDLNPTIVSNERFRFVGNNKWLGNFIYCTQGPDEKLYFKSANPQHMYIKRVQVRAVFNDPYEAAKMACELNECCEEKECDILETEFPLEDDFIIPLIDGVVTEMGNNVYSPQDTINNANDDIQGLNVKRN